MASQEIENKKTPPDKDFWKNLDSKASEHLSKLNEIVGVVLKMKIKCIKLQLELNNLHKPEYIQELLRFGENEEDKDIKRYMDMIELINEPKPPASQRFTEDFTK